MNKTTHAFPLAFPDEIDSPDHLVNYGMTLRDYFAAKAMQAAYQPFAIETEATKHWTTAGMAESAYAMADAMLAARNKS